MVSNILRDYLPYKLIYILRIRRRESFVNKLINLNTYPVNIVLKSLLKDKSTKQNIIFATNAYTRNDTSIDVKSQITIDLLNGFGSDVIQPRVSKSLEHQTQRTKNKAEVFTPSWICNKMNNHCDTEWFGRQNVFNIEGEQSWIEIEDKIEFPKDKSWKDYVDSRRLEITCGEAPYIASRYDTTTGEIIPVSHRIGILDRKLRVVNENTNNEEEWFKWTLRAYQSVYGYEFQGDNLLIARINLLITFCDYLKDRWGRDATTMELRKLTNIIVWNLWQMDGITGTIPFGTLSSEYQQLSFFDWVEDREEKKEESVACRIYDWRADKSITYNSLKER